MTVRDARSSFYARESLPPNGGKDARRWAISLGPLSIPLPNFGWRAKALPLHDLHHLLTGYPCTPSGEFEMAAWEFAAGRYPHPFATAFCLPLVGMGAVLRPRRTFDAFVRGRASRTLYARGLSDALLATSIDQLKHELLPPVQPAPRFADTFTYLSLVIVSAAWTLLPFAALVAVPWVV